MSHADVNGVSLYYEEHGSGEPLVLLHGGLGAGAMFGAIMPALSADRRVITVDLQGHGGTADVDRPLRPETMADDVAALIEHLGLPRADVMGYSLGGVVALRTAIQHPERVRRLVLVSVGFRRDGSHPEVVESMDRFAPGDGRHAGAVPGLRALRAPRAPRGGLAGADRQDERDCSRTTTTGRPRSKRLETPTMLVFADADSVRPAHIVEFYGLLGGGLRDANWDGSLRPTARLAILPGTTHYDIYASPALAAAVTAFLDADAL